MENLCLNIKDEGLVECRTLKAALTERNLSHILQRAELVTYYLNMDVETYILTLISIA